MMALNSSIYVDFHGPKHSKFSLPIILFFFFFARVGVLFPSDLYVSLYEVELLFIKKKICVFFHYFG